MGYSPKEWGSEGWHLIHYASLNYPLNPTEEDKKNYLSFLESLKFVLPCEGCAFNWSEKLKQHPPKLNSRKEFFEWTVDMHNQVNKTNGKKTLTYAEALKKISKKKTIEYRKDAALLVGTIVTAVFLLAYTISKKIKK